MSWDVSVEYPPCKECGREESYSEPEMSNYTHNCNEMMRRSLEAVGQLEPLGESNLYALNGRPCAEIGPILKQATDWWAAQPEGVMDDLVPSNGWGHADTALKFWTGIADLCLEHPRATLKLGG